MKILEQTTAKAAIQKAFLELLLQKAYMDITVSDLVNKAQVARMSFYRNFNSLDDVIESIVDDMAQDFNSDFIPVIKENNERKWRELLFEMIYRFIQMQKDFGIPFQEFTKKHENNNVIIFRMQERIMQAEMELSMLTITEKYTAIGKMNLIHGVISRWALMGMQETPEELINIIMSMIMKF